MMNNSKIILTALAFVSTTGMAAPKADKQQIREVPFNKVHLSDNFWLPRIEVNRTVSIPSAFHVFKLKFLNNNILITNLFIFNSYLCH